MKCTNPNCDSEEFEYIQNKEQANLIESIIGTIAVIVLLVTMAIIKLQQSPTLTYTEVIIITGSTIAISIINLIILKRNKKKAIKVICKKCEHIRFIEEKIIKPKKENRTNDKMP